MKHQGAFNRLLLRVSAEVERLNLSDKLTQAALEDQAKIAEMMLDNIIMIAVDILGSPNVDAIVDRAIVGETWPFGEGGPTWPVSPADVSLAEIAEALSRGKREEIKRLSESIEKVIRSAKEDKLKEIPPLPMADGGVMFTKFAIIISAQKQVEKDRYVQTGKMSAREIAYKTVQTMAAGPWDKDHDPKKAFSSWKTDPERLNSGRFQLLWGGKSDKPIQLELPANDSGLAAMVFLAQIQTELSEDGLLDWFTYHVMAEKQGSSGRFDWAYEEHLEIAGYGKRIKQFNMNHDDLARELMRRLEILGNTRLKYAEERINTKGERIVDWFVVGDKPLLSIPKGSYRIEADGKNTPILARVELNPVIYSGARLNATKPYFALVHMGIAHLKEKARTIGMLLSFQFRFNTDNGGEVRLKARTLWDYGKILQGKWVQAKNWSTTRRILENALDELGKTIEMDWIVESHDPVHGINGPETIYLLKAPPWWRDRVIHGVPPVLGNLTAGIPRNGLELKAWRVALGWSHRQVGEIVGASHQTMIRAEASEGKALKAEWVEKLAAERAK